MRPIRQRITGLTAKDYPWIQMDYIQSTFNAALAAIPDVLSAGGTTAYQGQYTLDDQSAKRPVSVTQTASTTATIVDPLHGMAVGDSVTLAGTGSGAGSGASIDGQYDVVSVIDVNTYTITTLVNQTSSFNNGPYTIQQRIAGNITGLNSSTGTRTAVALGVAAAVVAPVTAVRLKCTVINGGGGIDFLVVQGAG